MIKVQLKSEKLKEIAENVVNYYIESISETLYDDVIEELGYKETTDKFYKDFTIVYLNLTNMLLDDAIDSINRQKD